MSELQTSSRSRAWIVVTAATGINLVLGALYAWSVLGKAICTQWGWSKADAALPFSVATASFSLTMIFAGRAQDKIGPRWVAVLGGLLWGMGLLASSYVDLSDKATSPLLLAVTFGLLGGIGIGLGYSATTPPALKWFSPARKGLIVGIVVSGIGLAAVYAAPLTQYMLSLADRQHNIQQTFMYLGIGAMAFVCLLSLLITNPPAGYSPAAAKVAGPVATKLPLAPRREVDWREMLCTRQFYLLWAMMILGASAGLMIIAQIAQIAKGQAGIEWGYVSVALLAIFNTLGRFTAGTLSDRIGRTRTLMLAFTLQALNMFAFPFYTTPGLLLFGSMFTGLCYGTIFPLMPAAIADYYGVKNLGVNYGLLFTGFGVAGVCGPIFGGKINDAFHTWTPAFIIAAVMLLIGAALALIVRPPVIKQESA